MRHSNHPGEQRSERGVALLIALFALLLISAMVAGLILTSSTETAIDANYRTSTQAFYDARAGIEEGRGRLWSRSPNSILAWVNPTGLTVPVGTVHSILNPAAGEVVAPNNPANKYFDAEYAQEWGVPINNAAVNVITQNEPPVPAGGLNYAPYKWVRITPATEYSTRMNVDGLGVPATAPTAATPPLFYDGTQQLLSTQIAAVANGGQAWQVYTITALGVTPTGSQRLLQYNVAPVYLNLNFPSSLTFDGQGPVYSAPNSNPFMMNGNDRSGLNHVPGCTIPVQAGKPSIGNVRANPDTNQLTNDIPSNRRNHYEGCVSGNCLSTPAIADVYSQLSTTTEQTPAELDQLVQTMIQYGATPVTGPATGLTDYGSALQPVFDVVTGANNGAGGTGDLTLSGNVTGYGILVVTGTLTFQGTVGWRGIILVIGQGKIVENGGGTNEFDGAVLVAKTRDTTGAELTTGTGTPTVLWNGGGGNGVYYDSCWINNAQTSVVYQVLSFREISQ